MQQSDGAKGEQKEFTELKAKSLPPYDAAFDNASE